MQSVSSSGNSPEPPSSRFASIFGAVVALLTLSLPLLVIAYYSSPELPSPAIQTTPLAQTRE
ncbi:MAG: hypothetical protein AAGH78_08530 [Cyanobacteria bacterium P01_H01_bin.58]